MGILEKIRLPHVGFRKVKSVLAIFIGFWFWQLMRLFFPALEIHPIFIYIYGMIEIRDSSEKTVDLGKKRIKSTFTALGVGIPCMILLEALKGIAPEGWLHIGLELLILIGGVLLTLEVAEKVGCKAFCGLAAAIFIILIISYTTDRVFLYALLRCVQTIAGVFIAWLLNVKIFPYHGNKA
ncbi:MAG: hypothetical protein IJO31_08940 [Oscillospiraceae bacterium]|nr:hypothetical protein [Oscillospiraceae bacterium]